jgi:uncharacterized protein (DUF952 family)
MIFYLLPRKDWESERLGPVAVPAEEDRFVHCCDERQISYVRQRFFPVGREVVAVAFDPTRLPAETRYEPGIGGEPERFPHVYGTLPRELVEFVRGV